MSEDVSSLRKQLQQLARLHTDGALDDAAYQESRARLERRLVDAVMAGHGEPAADAPAIARPPAKLLSGLAAVVVVIAAVGYWWTRSTDTTSAMATDTAPVGEAASAPGTAPHAMSFDQIAAMADKLAQRLKEQPDDAEGWAMLARSYAVLGRNPDAVAAYEKAVALRHDDASLLADYADALAVKQQGQLAGEPARLIARALQLEPGNPKALSLAGTEAFNRQDYAAAARHWERVVQAGPADSPLVQQARSSLDEARTLGKLPAPARAEAAASTPVAAAGTSVSGSVSLAPALAAQASPGDTVFIFARAVGGAPMPLAVLRKQVKDLPVEFTLDDSLAMAPSARLSNVSQVVVSARISKSGDAIPQAGDLSGQTAAVAVGTRGLRVVIDTVVKK
ncbi:MAG: c-type cytochrome biogenesis protein CcmI [Rhizobacter sp.]|nr:c-type cytochrome biogenesis protein CcmI [Rhizobacter sp.]